MQRGVNDSEDEAAGLLINDIRVPGSTIFLARHSPESENPCRFRSSVEKQKLLLGRGQRIIFRADLLDGEFESLKHACYVHLMDVELQKIHFVRAIVVKERNYDFSRHVRKGPTVTKQEIADSLIAFAKEKHASTFTHKQYDAWNKRILCASQISHRFGGWSKAMERAGLSPKWNFSKNPLEMVELYMDCWEEHDDCPTEKAFEQYLSRVDSKYAANNYKNYFGGLRRLTQRVVDFHAKRISEKQLVAKWEPP